MKGTNKDTQFEYTTLNDLSIQLLMKLLNME